MNVFGSKFVDSGAPRRASEDAARQADESPPSGSWMAAARSLQPIPVREGSARGDHAVAILVVAALAVVAFVLGRVGAERLLGDSGAEHGQPQQNLWAQNPLPGPHQQGSRQQGPGQQGPGARGSDPRGPQQSGTHESAARSAAMSAELAQAEKGRAASAAQPRDVQALDVQALDVQAPPVLSADMQQSDSQQPDAEPAAQAPDVAATPFVSVEVSPSHGEIWLDQVAAGVGRVQLGAIDDGKLHELRFVAPDHEPTTVFFRNVPPTDRVVLRPIPRRDPAASRAARAGTRGGAARPRHAAPSAARASSRGEASEASHRARGAAGAARPAPARPVSAGAPAASEAPKKRVPQIKLIEVQSPRVEVLD